MQRWFFSLQVISTVLSFFIKLIHRNEFKTLIFNFIDISVFYEWKNVLSRVLIQLELKFKTEIALFKKTINRTIEPQKQIRKTEPTTPSRSVLQCHFTSCTPHAVIVVCSHKPGIIRIIQLNQVSHYKTNIEITRDSSCAEIDWSHYIVHFLR